MARSTEPSPLVPPTNRPQRRARSAELAREAAHVLVGGVNSPVRGFGAVGGEPIIIDRAKGPHIYDVDGNRYVDLVGSWGPAILGHAHPDVIRAVQEAAAKGLSFGATCEAEIRLGELILSALPGHEMIRFVNSGTEAVMSAIRLARAAAGAGRTRIVKFHGCYHGHADSLLVAAGSGAATTGVPDSAGVPREIAALTLLAHYNDGDGVAALFDQHRETIAAVLVEPVAGNMGLVKPLAGFLEQLREVCNRHGALLIFDEVMTGFRVGWGGYQNICNLRPDITCLGKVIGGGLPVAAYAARRELMEQVSPLGPVYQAGTLSGNPLGMAAGLATLERCRSAGFYEDLDRRAQRLAKGLQDAASAGARAVATGAIGGMAGLFFSANPVENFEQAKATDRDGFARFFRAMLDRGVFLPPSPFEAMFVSAAHGDAEIEFIIDTARDAFREAAP